MKQLNRWVYAIVGVIVLLFAGLVYAWSVLSTPIGAEFTGWTKAQLSLTFTLVMILFCIGSLLCGLLAGRLSAKNAVRLGAVLFLAGFFIASRCQSPLTLYLGFGVLCGLGSGLSYNAVMSTMVRWFPDRPGLISGVLLMGFGGGSFLIGKLYQAWTPAGVGGWRTSFLVLGIVCFAVLAVCSFFFVAPGADFTAPAVKGGNAVSRPAAADVTPGQMLKKTTFWLYYVWAIAVSAAGLALISQASGVVPMFITTLSQTRMKSRFLAADEYISPKKSNSVGASWLKPSRKIAHLRLSSPPYIMEAQRRQAR